MEKIGYNYERQMDEILNRLKNILHRAEIRSLTLEIEDLKIENMRLEFLNRMK